MEYILKNNLKITLREASVSDASALLIYMDKVNRESKNLMREPEEFTMTLEDEEKFINNTINSKDNCFILAFDGNLIISSSGFHGSALKRVNHRVSLGISVLEDYQGQGLGTIVMKELIKKAIELGKTKMDLEVRIDNKFAIVLYENLGFIKEGIIKNGFYVDNKFVDLLVMGKVL